jgi:hypothetical protein
VLAEVETAAKAAEAGAEEARAQALDPLVEDVIAAHRAMDDAAFRRDRLIEAAKRLGVRVDALKAREKARAQRAEHEQVLAERNRLAEEMGRMAEPIVQIAHLMTEIEACDREVGRVNALGLGHIPIVLSGAAPAIKALFQDAMVWDAFAVVAGLHPKRRSLDEARKGPRGGTLDPSLLGIPALRRPSTYAGKSQTFALNHLTVSFGLR